MDIRVLMRATGLALKDADQWSMLNTPLWGEIHGIPCLRGKLVARNGSLGIMLRNGVPLLVHSVNFVHDVDRTHAVKTQVQQVSTVKLNLLAQYDKL